MDNKAVMSMTREWGLKLIMTKLKLCGDPIIFFRQTQIDKWSLPEAVSGGLKVYEDVLWMRLLEVSEGIKMPNGCRWFDYIPFWKDIFPKGKKYYRFRNLIPKDETDILSCVNTQTRPWEIHSY